jgi:hypothetical protein
MNKKEILYALGYQDSKEEGASFEHPAFIWNDRFVWNDESLDETLSEHNARLERGIRYSIACQIKYD